jgi:hypothetical protein
MPLSGSAEALTCRVKEQAWRSARVQSQNELITPRRTRIKNYKGKADRPTKENPSKIGIRTFCLRRLGKWEDQSVRRCQRQHPVDNRWRQPMSPPGPQAWPSSTDECTLRQADAWICCWSFVVLWSLWMKQVFLIFIFSWAKKRKQTKKKPAWKGGGGRGEKVRFFLSNRTSRKFVVLTRGRMVCLRGVEEWILPLTCI